MQCKQSTTKKISIYAAISCATTMIICGGCVSDPFIAESIAKLDANPVPIANRFNLPGTPMLPIAPQPADMLLGTWETGILHPVHRSVDKDGMIHDLDMPGKFFHDTYKNFGFNRDGTYVHLDIYRMATASSVRKRSGTWTYESGKLTLHEKNEDFKYSDIALKSMGVPNWEQHFTTELNNTLKYDVKWFSNDEIVIVDPNDQTPLEQAGGKRKSTVMDKFGVKTERSINVTGMREGRETGTVSEEIYPPMHFKRKST